HALQQENALLAVLLPPLATAGDLLDEFTLSSWAVTHCNASLGGLVETGHAIEDSRLACSIWTNKGRDISPTDRKRKVTHRNQSAEAHGQVLNCQHRIGFPVRQGRSSRTFHCFSH